MLREDIKRNILQKIDEISPYSNTDEQWDLLIEGMLDDMANRYMSIIPISWINGYTDPFTALVPQWDLRHGVAYWYDTAYAYLPEDFNRIISVGCIHFRRLITGEEIRTTDSGEFNRQFDRHTRAGVAKPKAFIGEGRRITVCPFKNHWNINDLHIEYIKKISAEEMPDRVLDGFFYYTASAVLTSKQQENFAKVMMEKCNEFLAIKQ